MASLFFALLALLCFGFWGFFTKLTLNYVNSQNALVYQTLGVLIVGFLIFSLLKGKLTLDDKGIWFGLLTGLAYGFGCWFYFLAADRGKITTVVTLTALYPIITILLAFGLLKETVSIKQCFGIGLALIAIFLMST